MQVLVTRNCKTIPIGNSLISGLLMNTHAGVKRLVNTIPTLARKPSEFTRFCGLTFLLLIIVDHFTHHATREGIGGVGPRSVDILHSALHRQFSGYDGIDKWNTNYELIATLFFGLIKGHPFFDANKRTAFLTLLFHLQKVKLGPTMKQRELENLAVCVAENGLSKYPRYAKFKMEPEINFLADYLRKNTRRIDKQYYAVTYHDLRSILRERGFDLTNPKKNYIDIVRYEDRRRFLGIAGKTIRKSQRIGQIGFPGWTTKVGKGAIKTVRQVTKLTPENGFDSQTFFKNADPMPVLISEYRSPLSRLANR